jgi:orotate phosphoribosyltransferase
MSFESVCTHDLLRDLILDCHHRGDFTLSSGKKATEYFDLAPLLLGNVGLQAVCFDIESKLSGIKFDAMACYELCPVPILGAYIRGRHPSVKGLIVRKQRKGHGTNRLIEGAIQRLDRVVVIEDVTSTGASVIKAIQSLENAGCLIVAIVTIVNRQEGCEEALGYYNFTWLFTKEELHRAELDRDRK